MAGLHEPSIGTAFAEKSVMSATVARTATHIYPTQNDTMPATLTAPTSEVALSTFVKKQRQKLLDLRDALVDAIDGVTTDTIRNLAEGSEATGGGLHQGDAGSDAYDRDFALSVLANEQDALYEIQQALSRIERGAYGICQVCGKRIPNARLEAIPFARLTVECQADWEAQQNSTGFHKTYREPGESRYL